MEIKPWTIVTGATGAMGSAAVEALAADGQPVIMACRNLSKAETVRSAVLARHPSAQVEIRQLDLSSLASVRRFAESIEAGSVHALFNNAGVIPKRFEYTAEGLENSLCVNYIGPWLLTRLLAGKMPAGAHVVNMVSLTCRFPRISPDILQDDGSRFSKLGTYARGKRALLSFSLEFARRNPFLIVHVADPGVVASDMIDLGNWFDPLADILVKPLCKTPRSGVQPALNALAAPGIIGSNAATGHSTGTVGASDTRQEPLYYVGKKAKPIPRRYRTPELDRALWNATEEILAEFLASLPEIP